MSAKIWSRIVQNKGVMGVDFIKTLLGLINLFDASYQSLSIYLIEAIVGCLYDTRFKNNPYNIQRIWPNKTEINIILF